MNTRKTTSLILAVIVIVGIVPLSDLPIYADGAMVAEVAISDIAEPAVGSSPSSSFTIQNDGQVDGVNCSVLWYELDAPFTSAEDIFYGRNDFGTFKANKYYVAEIYLCPNINDGYCFPSDSAEFFATVNGKEATCTTVYEYFAYVYYAYKFIAVTFCYGDGVTANTVQYADSSGRLASLPTPARKNYSFDGWYDAEDGGNRIDADKIYTENTQVYAHWSVCNHTQSTAKPNCDSTAVCSVCGGTIAALGHDFAEGMLVNTEEEGHYNRCSRCNADDTAHISSHEYDNSCDAYCNICSYVRTITHSYSDLQGSEAEHWYICSVCDAEKPDSHMLHSYDGDGGCICGAQQIISTDEGGADEQNQNRPNATDNIQSSGSDTVQEGVSDNSQENVLENSSENSSENIQQSDAADTSAPQTDEASSESEKYSCKSTLELSGVLLVMLIAGIAAMPNKKKREE